MNCFLIYCLYGNFNCVWEQLVVLNLPLTAIILHSNSIFDAYKWSQFYCKRMVWLYSRLPRDCWPAKTARGSQLLTPCQNSFFILQIKLSTACESKGFWDWLGCWPPPGHQQVLRSAVKLKLFLSFWGLLQGFIRVAK